jgi:hypothetical protein
MTKQNSTLMRYTSNCFLNVPQGILNGDITITGEGLQNLGLCSVLRAFEQGEIFIVPHLL